MPWSPTYIHLTLKEKIVFTARKLGEAMADQRKPLGIALPLVCLLDARFRYLINQLLAAIAATPNPIRLRKPRPARIQTDPPREIRPPRWLRTWPTIALGPPPPLSRAFGILRRTFAHYAINGYVSQIEHLLTTQDMVEAIALNPAIPRILRPPCHLCGINPPANIALPPRPRRKRPQRAKPVPKPPVPASRDPALSMYVIPHPENPRNFLAVFPPGHPCRFDTPPLPKKSR